LVTLGILSFTGIIIWSVFFQGATYTQRASTKNELHQEANIVITKLTKIHQTSDQYQISNTGCKLTVTINTNQIQEINNSKYCISVRLVNIDTNEVLVENSLVDPNNNDISFQLTIYDLDDNRNSIVENGILYRLKGGGV
jgi:hypothetical protein